MDSVEDATLVEQAKTDREAFGRLYDEHYNRIFNYVVRRTANVHITQDITSDVFFKALHNIESYRWNGVPFSAWLYRIAGNEIANYYRKQQRQQISEAELVKFSSNVTSSAEAELIQAEAEIERKQEYLILHKQLSLLPLKYQEVITLRYFEKKQLSEIGEILGKKEGTIKSLLHRGLEKLRKNMK
jgi:RNA polymerase sigma-70 factor (ECF subfamily)